MTMIDSLTNEMGSRFGIGARAQPLMREFLQVMTGGPGGLGGFLDRFRNAGLGSEVSGLMGGTKETVLPPTKVDAVLGDATVAGISQRVGLAPSVVSTAAGFEIPKLIAFLTPGGKLPNTLPNEVQNFVRTSDQVPPVGMSVVGETEQVRPSAQVPPQGMATVREAPRRNILPWIIGLLALAALLGWLLSRRPNTPAPVATAPAPTVAPVARAPVAPAPVVTSPAPATVAGGLNDINAFLTRTVLHFPTGSAILPPGSSATLRMAADHIKRLPSGTVIEIAGHTDNTGNAASNMTLSQRRAEAVRDVLVRDGVSPTMLTARGYGETQPVASNDTDSGRAQNRRITFSVAGQGSTNTTGAVGPGSTDQGAAAPANSGG